MNPSEATTPSIDAQLESEFSARRPAPRADEESPAGRSSPAAVPRMPGAATMDLGTGRPASAITAGLPPAVVEAIIRIDFTRPSLVIRNSTFDLPAADSWRAQLIPSKAKLERAIRSVGRVELTNHPTFPWVGTAWMVADRIAITNRHVALEFARKSGLSFPFSKAPGGATILPRVDFREEDQISQSAEFPVKRVIFIENNDDKSPDMAFLEFEKSATLPTPIDLLTKAPTPEQIVAVIGYPANDPRNPAGAIAGVFGTVFEVKRLAPGKVMANDAGFLFTHDCSTLGGNSGSVVVDVETGRALGLHFGGSFQKANFAVEAAQIQKRLKALKVQVSVPALPKPKPAPDSSGTVKPGALAGRAGFQSTFLGSGFETPLPAVTTNAPGTVAAVKGASDNVLRYTHFSIVMNRTRRFAFFTASNIDGSKAKRVARATDKWFLDPRVALNDQTGEELYQNNELDRGHLVRRLDPVWGTDAEAKIANDDTFFFTNSTPQHAQFNQKTWNDLEDYILDNAGVHQLKVNVYTGPVFQPGDKTYRGVQLPEQYWKVVAMVKDGSPKKLSVTAYMLSQRDLLSTLEFAFGQFRTYQLPVSEVERQTGLDFGKKFRDADPLNKVEARPIRELISLTSIVT
ncbi:MAG: DNA/RNA non-specific endonuclease [Acidobacteriota bacterium]